MTWLECALCGQASSDVRPGLAAYRDPPTGRPYDHVDRCTDRQACRNRVEARGESWPLIDITVSKQPAERGGTRP